MAATLADMHEETLDERYQFVRVYVESGDGKTHFDLEDVDQIKWLDGKVVIHHREDYGGDRRRYWHFNKERVIGYKLIQTPREWQDPNSDEWAEDAIEE